VQRLTPVPAGEIRRSGSGFWIGTTDNLGKEQDMLG